MSISAISGSSGVYPTSQQTAQQQELQALTKAISSGDLSDAQQAYATLTQSQSASGDAPDPNSPLGQALAQIGKDLQSGDISSAQQTLSSLKSKAHGHGGHHHHAAPPDQTASSTTTTSTADPLTAPSPASSLIDITA